VNPGEHRFGPLNPLGLAAIRDPILPELSSGEIGIIKDTEKFMETSA
jgi:hypothetical protein